MDFYAQYLILQLTSWLKFFMDTVYYSRNCSRKRKHVSFWPPATGLGTSTAAHILAV